MGVVQSPGPRGPQALQEDTHGFLGSEGLSLVFAPHGLDSTQPVSSAVVTCPIALRSSLGKDAHGHGNADSGMVQVGGRHADFELAHGVPFGPNHKLSPHLADSDSRRLSCHNYSHHPPHCDGHGSGLLQQTQQQQQHKTLDARPQALAREQQSDTYSSPRGLQTAHSHQFTARRCSLASHSSVQLTRLLSSVVFVALLLSCCWQTGKGATVFLEKIELVTTHELPFWSPQVYFKCEGEEGRDLTGVVQSKHPYNFSFHENFQPLTELDPPQCKWCGLYEADTWTDDDVFDRWELCPLEFSPAPVGHLTRRVKGEFNITLKCQSCNLVNSITFSETEDGTTALFINPFFLLFVLLGIFTTVASLIGLCLYCINGESWPMTREGSRRGAGADGKAGFVELVGDEDVDDLDLDLENDFLADEEEDEDLVVVVKEEVEAEEKKAA